jgi:hypothetical protein
MEAVAELKITLAKDLLLEMYNFEFLFSISTLTLNQCCSQAGWCGSTSAYCGGGCQTKYGTCNTGSLVSNDGSCGGANGYTCTGSTFGTW